MGIADWATAMPARQDFFFLSRRGGHHAARSCRERPSLLSPPRSAHEDTSHPRGRACVRLRAVRKEISCDA